MSITYDAEYDDEMWVYGDFYQALLIYWTWADEGDGLIQACVGVSCDDFPTIDDFDEIPMPDYVYTDLPIEYQILSHDHRGSNLSYSIVGKWKNRKPTAKEIEALKKQIIG